MCDQPGVSAVVLAGHQCALPDARMLGQRGLDLAQLDSHTANLHLIIEAPEVIDVAVREVPRQVAGAVHQLVLVLGERIRQEARGHRLGPVEVTAPNANAADEQLAGNTHRHGLAMGVQEMDADVRNRSPDRNRRARSAPLAMEVGGRDGGLSGAVLVPQLGVQHGMEPLSELVGHHLAAARYPAQCDAVRHCRLGKKRPQHRRHEERCGD